MLACSELPLLHVKANLVACSGRERVPGMGDGSKGGVPWQGGGGAACYSRGIHDGKGRVLAMCAYSAVVKASQRVNNPATCSMLALGFLCVSEMEK